VNSASGLSAGFVLIAVVGVFIAVGIGIGTLLDAQLAGGFAGGVLGVIAGFVVVYRVFLVPMRKASMARDYSHLTPITDDDDD
jgi:hypothetical protein